MLICLRALLFTRPETRAPCSPFSLPLRADPYSVSPSLPFSLVSLWLPVPPTSRFSATFDETFHATNRTCDLRMDFGASTSIRATEAEQTRNRNYSRSRNLDSVSDRVSLTSSTSFWPIYLNVLSRREPVIQPTVSINTRSGCVYSFYISSLRCVHSKRPKKLIYNYSTILC